MGLNISPFVCTIHSAPGLIVGRFPCVARCCVGAQPIFVAGKKMDEGTKWRSEPDGIALGKNTLSAICSAAPAPKPAGCAAVEW
jgi:hypothetical protein